MESLIGWQSYETQFNSKPIKMELRTLKRNANLILISHLDVFQILGEKNSAVLKNKKKPVKLSSKDVAAISNMLDDFQPFFTKHVRNIEGDFGFKEKITPEVLIDEAPFMNLALEIITELTIITALTQADEKN